MLAIARCQNNIDEMLETFDYRISARRNPINMLFIEFYLTFRITLIVPRVIT